MLRRFKTAQKIIETNRTILILSFCHLLRLRLHHIECGETFQDHSGAFSSPGYYALSQSNIIASIYHPEHCEWRITGRHDARIALNITRLAIPQSLNCSSDYLEIRDGYWHRSPMIGRRICGFDRVNELFVTHSNRMLITYYRTTPQKRGRYFNGFTATYETACGGEATGGQIKSPNYPERYWPNQNCVWLITVPEGHQVALQFITFDVENSTNCVRDYVEVRDGHSAASELIAVYCGGPLPRAVQSTLNKMHVRFVSNGAIARQGFHANYTEVVNECLTPDHGCSHMCINTIAGYDCACPVGYKLLSDNKTCDRKPPTIYYLFIIFECKHLVQYRLKRHTYTRTHIRTCTHPCTCPHTQHTCARNLNQFPFQTFVAEPSMPSTEPSLRHRTLTTIPHPRLVCGRLKRHRRILLPSYLPALTSRATFIAAWGAMILCLSTPS